MSATKKKWEKVGSILQSKKGGYYLKMETGEVLLLKKPQDDVASLLERGIITQEQADERLSKIPTFVKFNVIRPPTDSNGEF